MKRRDFISKTVLTSGGLFLTHPLLAAKHTKRSNNSKKLVILHTNDTHSNIESFPSNHPKYPNLGGVVNRSKIIERIRKEEEHVLLLDSGDIFQGTPYFNRYRGILEMKIMTKLGYDAATLGNHDFDIGISGFNNAAAHANFPFVNANYDVSNTPLQKHLLPYIIKNKAGLKIGIFGLGVDLNGLVVEENWKGITFLDTVDQANITASLLKRKGCDLVICLSHLGHEYKTDKISDLQLAKNTSNIDLILGGHTHTFLQKPVCLKNSTHQEVMINQVGWAGLFLGRIDIEIFSGKRTNNTEIIQ